MNSKNLVEQQPRILLTGATGYVGGRLLKSLEVEGHRVRCLARRPEFLRPRVTDTTEVVQGDVLDPTSLANALDSVHTAYYLVHSMGSTGAFEDEDRQAARNFAAAARAAGVQRIIYLGGLGDRRRKDSLRICAVGTRLVTSCASPGCRWSSFAPQSSLVRAVSRLK